MSSPDRCVPKAARDGHCFWPCRSKIWRSRRQREADESSRQVRQRDRTDNLAGMFEHSQKLE